MIVDGTMLETPFQNLIVDVGHLHGWHVASFRTSQQAGRYMTAARYDGVGYPDLTMIHKKGAILFVEVKTETGRLSKEQKVWGHKLGEATSEMFEHSNPTYGVHYYVWRPRDSDNIMSVLSFGKTKEWAL